MIITHELTMDLVHSGVMPKVNAVQGDINSRKLRLSLYAAGVVWEIPKDVAVAMRYSKPDGTRGIYDTLPDGSTAWSIEGNVISMTLAPQMLTAAGSVFAQIVMTRNADLLATFSLQINVARDPSAGTAVSENYVNWLQACLKEEMQELFQAAKDAGELNGPQGLTPTVETERFDDGIQSGVKLIVTNPGTGNQLDQVTVTRILDGANGMTPRIGSVAVEMLEPEEAATGSISGVTNNLKLALSIPRGEQGPQGEQGPAGDAAAKPVFVISGMYNGTNCWVHQYGDGAPATVEEMVDAFFGGGICQNEVLGDTVTLSKTHGTFFISNNTVKYGDILIFEGTEEQYQNALSKYLEE